MGGQPLAPGVLAIIVIAGFVTYLGFTLRGFMEQYLFSPYEILRKKEYYRLVTSGFLHADWFHFGFNAFTFYSFGTGIELVYGLPYLLIIFFASVIGGNLLSLWLHRNHEYQALGASGGVCGIIYASIFLLPGGSVYLFLIPIPIPAYIYAVLFLFISIYGIQAARDNIGHDAHLGGAIVGLLVTTALQPAIVKHSPVLYAVVLAISAGAFLYFWKHPWGDISSLKRSLSRLFDFRDDD